MDARLESRLQLALGRAGRGQLVQPVLLLLAGQLYLADRFAGGDAPPNPGAGKLEATRRHLDGQPRSQPAELRLPPEDSGVGGHRAGVDAVRRVVEVAPSLGISTLTLFAFSSANWQRPAEEVQALMLDGHHLVDNRARWASQHLFNFSGTGGMWRRQAIADAGGWQHDTLTEDLDLSYRAQLAGWKFVYREDVVSPAELPEDCIDLVGPDRGTLVVWSKADRLQERETGGARPDYYQVVTCGRLRVLPSPGMHIAYQLLVVRISLARRRWKCCHGFLNCSGYVRMEL